MLMQMLVQELHKLYISTPRLTFPANDPQVRNIGIFLGSSLFVPFTSKW